MKSMINSAVVALLLVTLAGTAAFGKSKKGNVTFESDVNVNGTTVKRGAYDVVFDDETSELSIVKSGKVVAKASARVEKRANKARSTQTRTNMAGNEIEFLGITFGGSDQNILVNQAGMQAGGNN